MRDPIGTELIKNRFVTAADEMSATLIRSALSTAIKESADASTAIFDANGYLVAQSRGTILLQLASLHECLQAVLHDYPAGAMRAGDVCVMNDPFRGGIHANDVAAFAPVLIDSSVAFIVGAIVHVADLGGVSPGGLPAQATEVYQEGLLLPPVLLYKEGARNDAIAKIIALNSRAPVKVLGDIGALIAANNIGARRVSELVSQFTVARVLTAVRDLLDYTEQRTRDAISLLDPGPHSSEFLIDGDGVSGQARYKVVVAVSRVGSDLVVDCRGTDAQANGPINASYSQSLSGALFGLLCLVDASIPLNEGSFRPLRVRFPEGTLVNPRPPAALNARVVTVGALVEAMLQVLPRLRPPNAVAASALGHVYTVSGTYADPRRPWLLMDQDYGGIGARTGLDGVDASGPFFYGGRANVIQIEAIEAEYPLRYRALRLVPDSGGPGQQRGGLGVERTVEVLTDVELSVRAARVDLPPPGANGGESGRPGAWIVNRGRPRERRLRAKQMNVRLKAGQTLSMLTSGGGGFGSPYSRDPRLVQLDVSSGRVTRAGARADYGVVIRDEAGDVDREATQELRSALASGGTS